MSAALAAPCGAVILPTPQPVDVRWTDSGYATLDEQSRMVHSWRRQFDTYLGAPCWRGYEVRYAADGGRWLGPVVHMTDNGFGELVEVRS